MGLVARDSRIIVNDCHFVNITPDNPGQAGNAGLTDYDEDGVAIYCRNTLNRIEHNTITTAEAGIVCIGRGLEVNFNNIQQVRDGIFGLNSTQRFPRIVDNVITDFTRGGIYLLDPNAAPLKPFITKNVLSSTVYESVSRGIYMRGVNSNFYGAVIDNNLTLTEDFTGIFLENSSNQLLDINEVYGGNATNFGFRVGIRLQASDENRIYNNIVNGEYTRFGATTRSGWGITSFSGQS